jgi:alginate O-acetyltransferase complex protein AlgI
MLFNSPLFIIYFLPLFLDAYYLVPNQWKNLVALFASLAFYAWGAPTFALILMLSGTLDYYLSKKLKSSDVLPWLYVGVGYNLATLFLFKYFNFFIENVHQVFDSLGLGFNAHLELVLPIGISFFTFQKISYLVDVYRGDSERADSLINYLLFVSLFPQLIAGPIVRYKEIANQLGHRFESDNWQNRLGGMYRFIIGLSKKVLIADALIPIVSDSFGVSEISAPQAWIGLLAYTMQIYFDFSGYSDMAIGLGRMMGFRFPENFDWPYIAKGFQDFWARWHITLSNFMRDYLYIPLGGNRNGKWLNTRNLWIVFLLSGFWHGASWTFVLWGAWHGFFITIDRFSSIFRKLPSVISQVLTLLLVMLGWVWFRSETMHEALVFFHSLFSWNEFEISLSNRAWFVLGLCLVFSVIPAVSRLNLEVVFESNNKRSDLYKSFFAFALLILCLGQMALSHGKPFIYFRF